MNDQSASRQIDDIISQHADWKADTLSHLRKVITAAAPKIIEQVKWKTASRPEGLPVWSHNGIVCIAEVWKDNIKLIFFKGADMSDGDELFNARLKGSTDRAIEFREGDVVDEAAIGRYVVEAVGLNK